MRERNKNLGRAAATGVLDLRKKVYELSNLVEFLWNKIGSSAEKSVNTLPSSLKGEKKLLV